MEDLTPQEKIDLIDLVRYAYDNKYIKWHCEMKMDDPIRKIMQRVLTKMFKGATITKNRRAGAYNVSFTAERRFHGNRPDYISGDIFMPSKFSSIKQYIAYFLADFDEIFCPYIHTAVKTKKIIPHYSRWNSYPYQGEEPLEVPFTQDEIDISSKEIDTKETKDGLLKLLDLFDNFQAATLTMQQEITIEANIEDSYSGRRYRYAKRVLTPQDYGFSLYYKILEDYDSHRMNIRKNRKLIRPLIRRFNKEGELITRLEGLAKAFKIFKRISPIFEKYKSFIYAVRCLMNYTEAFIDNDDLNLNLTDHEKGTNRFTLVNMALDSYFHTKHFKLHPFTQNVLKMRQKEKEELENSENRNLDNRLDQGIDRTPNVPLPASNAVRIGNVIYDKNEIKRKFFESLNVVIINEDDAEKERVGEDEPAIWDDESM